MAQQDASGLLSAKTRPIQLQRYEVPQALSSYLEYFWSVHWQLPEGESYTSVNIPFPCSHIVYEAGATGIFGPVKGSFHKTLHGQGFVLGARFKSGYFSAYSGWPAHRCVDQQWDLNALFNISSAEFENLAPTTAEQAMHHLSDLLSTRVNDAMVPPTEKHQLAYDIVQTMEARSDWLRVEQVQTEFQLSPRALERLFRDYVGLTPKWVIRLFRLQQLADHLVEQESIDWAGLAVDLGYFDQAHCIKDFKAFTGKSPGHFPIR